MLTRRSFPTPLGFLGPGLGLVDACSQFLLELEAP